MKALESETKLSVADERTLQLSSHKFSVAVQYNSRVTVQK